MNAINLAKNIFAKKDRKILLYRNYSNATSEILDGIRKYDIFDVIYVYNLIPKNNKIIYLFNDFIQAVFPKIFVKWITRDHVTIENEEIDCITLTSGTELEVALTRIFPRAKTIAYDDGLGSYVGDIIHDQKLHWIWRVLGRRTDKIWPECLYVNNVQFCKSTLTGNKKALVSFENSTNQYKNMIFDIFNSQSTSLYADRPIVYLSQPLYELKEYKKEFEKEIENILVKFDQYGVFRKHPRDTYNTRLEYAVDSSNCIWELICANHISDKNVLVSVCSTAQIIPKILYNKEPWIIFTYKLCGIENGYVFRTRFAPIIQRIKSEYFDSKKIFEPKTFQELEEILNTILLKIEGQTYENK